MYHYSELPADWKWIFSIMHHRCMVGMAPGPGWSSRVVNKGLNKLRDMAHPCSAWLLGVTGALCIGWSALAMAAWLSRCAMWRKGPTAVTRACSRGVRRISSAPEPLSTFQDKPRTMEDLPRVSFFELIYRMTFQGFHNRLHELQVGLRHSPWMTLIYIFSRF